MIFKIIEFIRDLFISKSNKNQNHSNDPKSEIMSDKTDEQVLSFDKPKVVYSPVRDRYVTSPFGYRMWYGKKVWHNGTDYAGTTNKLCCCPVDCYIKKDLPYDKDYPYVFIWKNGRFERAATPQGRAWTPYTVCVATHDKNLKFIFRHGSHNKKVGDICKGGEMFYTVGNYGYSQGSHLHIELYVNGKIQDIEKWLDKQENLKLP